VHGSGERVSNTWITYLYVGDNSGKLGLIPHDIILGHLRMIKDVSRKKMDPRPIS
jgi:hypothetical protein